MPNNIWHYVDSTGTRRKFPELHYVDSTGTRRKFSDIWYKDNIGDRRQWTPGGAGGNGVFWADSLVVSDFTTITALGTLPTNPNMNIVGGKQDYAYPLGSSIVDGGGYGAPHSFYSYPYVYITWDFVTWTPIFSPTISGVSSQSSIAYQFQIGVTLYLLIRPYTGVPDFTIWGCNLFLWTESQITSPTSHNAFSGEIAVNYSTGQVIVAFWNSGDVWVSDGNLNAFVPQTVSYPSGTSSYSPIIVMVDDGTSFNFIGYDVQNGRMSWLNVWVSVNGWAWTAFPWPASFQTAITNGQLISIGYANGLIAVLYKESTVGTSIWHVVFMDKNMTVQADVVYTPGTSSFAWTYNNAGNIHYSRAMDRWGFTRGGSAGDDPVFYYAFKFCIDSPLGASPSISNLQYYYGTNINQWRPTIEFASLQPRLTNQFGDGRF